MSDGRHGYHHSERERERDSGRDRRDSGRDRRDSGRDRRDSGRDSSSRTAENPFDPRRAQLVQVRRGQESSSEARRREPGPNVSYENRAGHRVTSRDSADPRYDRTTTWTTPNGDTARLSAAGPENVRVDVNAAPHSLTVEQNYDHTAFSYAHTEEGIRGGYDTQSGRVTVAGADGGVTYDTHTGSVAARAEGTYAGYDAQTGRVTVATGDGGIAYEADSGRVTVGNGEQNHTYNSFGDLVRSPEAAELGARVVQSFVMESINRHFGTEDRPRERDGDRPRDRDRDRDRDRPRDRDRDRPRDRDRDRDRRRR